MAHVTNLLLPIRFEFRPVLGTWSLQDEKLQWDDGSKATGGWTGKIAPKSRDAWDMRADFFRLLKRGSRGGDVSALLEFLNRWGPWRSFLDRFTPWDGEYRTSFTPEEIWQRGELFRGALLDSKGPGPVRWLSDTGTTLVATSTRSEYPFQVLETRSCEFAMRMTVTIDLLRQLRYRPCKRQDCAGVFTSSDPRKKFCSQYCGHLVSVRKQRGRQRRRAR